MTPTPVELWQRYDDDEQRLSAHVSDRMIELAGLVAGDQVLDIATGRGEPALRAARRVAPGGFVLGTDRSDDMLGFARARADAESVANLRTLAVDAHTLDGVPDASFDAALCRWGFMFFDRPREALSAVRRCCKAGAPLVAAVWAEPARVAWWSMPRQVLSRHASIPAMDPGAPGTFRYAAAEAFAGDLDSAGFQVVHQEELTTPVMESATPQGLIDWCLAFGIARLLKAQPDSVRRAWEKDMRDEAQAHRGPDGVYRLGGVTRLVMARATAQSGSPRGDPG
jgi:ubiquinone/menaquinone biosynthesis C-methylase UbiE